MSFPATFPLAGTRIWVTGGHGFLGRYLVEELTGAGVEVLTPGRAECDLLDPGAALAFLRRHRPKGVIHLAAMVGGIGANRAHPGSFFYGNLAMGLHLVEACRVARVDKLLVLGTVCAYPGSTRVPFRECDLWNGYPEATNAPYGLAKKALLVQLQAYRQEYGTRGIYLLPVNLYGARDHMDPANSHVIPALARKILEARAGSLGEVELWGSGAASREFLHARDAARGIRLAMERYEGAEPVNLGTGEEITIRNLAFKIMEIVGYYGQLRFNAAYPDGQMRRRLDTSRALEGFGWKAEIPFADGLREAVAWVEAALKP